MTVLFCDLTGSTAIGERTDPEALRALDEPVLRRRTHRARAPRRDGREVRRRCGDGGVRDPGGERGRCVTRGACRGRAARRRPRARPRGSNRRQHGRGGRRRGRHPRHRRRGERGRAARTGGEPGGDPDRRRHLPARARRRRGRATALHVKGKSEPVPALRLVRLDAAAAGVRTTLRCPSRRSGPRAGAAARRLRRRDGDQLVPVLHADRPRRCRKVPSGR